MTLLRIVAVPAFLATVLAASLAAQENPQTPTESPPVGQSVLKTDASSSKAERKTELDARTLQIRMEYIDELEKSGALSERSAELERSTNLGRYPIPVTAEEVPRLIWREWRQLGATLLYWLALIVALGVALTLTAEFWALLGTLLLTILGSIGVALFEFLKNIPEGFYQTVGIGISAYLLYFNHYALLDINSTWLAMAGGALLLVVLLWIFGSSESYSRAKDPVPFVALISALAWGVAAISRESQFIGFFAVVALHVSFGFSAWFGELCTAIGFKDEKELNQAMFISAFALLLGVGSQVAFDTPHMTYRPDLGTFERYVALFQPGLVGMGAFVFYLALEIKCSAHVSKSAHGFWSLVMLILGPVGAYVGTVCGFSELRAIAILFFLLFLSWKLSYLCYEAVGGRLALLAGSIATCFLAGYIYNHPDSWTYLIRVKDLPSSTSPATIDGNDASQASANNP